MKLFTRVHHTKAIATAAKMGEESSNTKENKSKSTPLSSSSLSSSSSKSVSFDETRNVSFEPLPHQYDDDLTIRWYSPSELQGLRDENTKLVNLILATDRALMAHEATDSSYDYVLQRQWLLSKQATATRKNAGGDNNSDAATVALDDTAALQQLYVRWYTRYGLEKQLVPQLGREARLDRERLLAVIGKKKNVPAHVKTILFQVIHKKQQPPHHHRMSKDEELQKSCERITLPSQRLARAIAQAVAKAA